MTGCNLSVHDAYEYLKCRITQVHPIGRESPLYLVVALGGIFNERRRGEFLSLHEQYPFRIFLFGFASKTIAERLDLIFKEFCRTTMKMEILSWCESPNSLPDCLLFVHYVHWGGGEIRVKFLSSFHSLRTSSPDSLSLCDMLCLSNLPHEQSSLLALLRSRK